MKKRSLSIIALIALLFPLLLVSCFGTDSEKEEIVTYDVTVTFPNDVGNGNVTMNDVPIADQVFNEGTKVSLAFTKDEAFRIDSVVVTKTDLTTNLGSLVTHEITALDANYVYAVYISEIPLNSYTVSGAVIGGGTLTPVGDQVVTEGGTVTFTYAAQSGYQFDSLLVDGVKTAGFESSYAFENVTANHSLAVYYSEIVTESMVDELFDTLLVRLERWADAQSMDDVTAEEFGTLATGFKSFLGNDSSHMKAGVGYIVSSVANLNSNAKLKEVADSLDSYVTALDEYWSEEDSRTVRKTKLFSRAYQKGGIEGFGTAILANSPKLMRTNGTIPSFPQLITVGKIQSLIETEILPVLDGVIGVIEDVESAPDNELELTFDGETFEIDLGEIYLTDASLRLLRHTLLFVTAYNYDVMAPDGQDLHAVVDTFMQLGDESDYVQRKVFSLSNDTLFMYWHSEYGNEDEVFSYMYDLINHNMNRSDFLSLKRQNHAKMHADIKMVPVLIKKAIASISAEGDDQEDDVLKIADIEDLTAEMVDLAEDMKLEGLSAAFAENFASPTALADYISQALSGPVTFKETIDGVTFDYTVDFSKFYTNPVQNFKDWFPLYKMNEKANALMTDTVEYSVYPISGNSFTVYDGDSVEIDPTLVDSTVVNSWGDTTYYLKSSFNFRVDSDVYEDFMPILLLDPEGNTIASSLDDVEDNLFDLELFPHFKDYTFNGIFPDMTREKWFNFFQDLDNLL